MKTLNLFLLPVLDSLEFGWRIIRYALIFVSAFFRQRASLGCSIESVMSRCDTRLRLGAGVFPHGFRIGPYLVTQLERGN